MSKIHFFIVLLAYLVDSTVMCIQSVYIVNYYHSNFNPDIMAIREITISAIGMVMYQISGCNKLIDICRKRLLLLTFIDMLAWCLSALMLYKSLFISMLSFAVSINTSSMLIGVGLGDFENFIFKGRSRTKFGLQLKSIHYLGAIVGSLVIIKVGDLSVDELVIMSIVTTIISNVFVGVRAVVYRKY